MIAEDYVSFETAKLLLEKGYPFNDCWNWYIDFDNISSHNDDDEGDGEVEINECHYPLISLGVAMKWLRETHNIIPIILTGGDSQNPFYYWFRIDMVKEGKWEDAIYREDEKEFPTYEEACEAAIKYCLEILI